MSIRVITEPTIRLVGRQTIDEAALDDFLKDEAAETWTTDTENAGQKLVEVAGRLCYKSYAKPRPGGNAAYIGHILEVGHGCYDEETEVLTADGWKSWPDVKVEDELATRRSDGAIEYRRPTNLVAAEYSGRMYRVDSRGVDLLVTPNHRMFVCPTTTREGRRKDGYEFIRADELDGRSHAYLKTGTWDHDSGRDPNADVARLLGFAIGDGNIGERSGCVRFHLRRRRKIEWLAEVAGRAGWKLTGEGDRFTLQLPKEWIWFFRDIYGPDRQKRIPQRILTEWSFYGLLSLYQGLMEADGHKGETGDSFDTTSPVLAGQFQQLCLHLGVAANVSYTLIRVPAGGSFGTKPITRLSVITRETRPEVNKYANAKGRTSWVEDWSGMVYCAEVPGGTLYVRRNGKPVWCGNSVTEHAVYSFIITGVSRSFTHELVRHRAGMSYSQRSQRFCDESEGAMVIPPFIEEACRREFEEASGLQKLVQGMRRRWHHSVSVAQEQYAAIVADADAYLAITQPDLDRTLRRKKAREAARSVLPNATETQIFVTVNARAARHFIEARGDEHADAEIRRVALRMLAILQGESPNLFGDYAVEDRPGIGPVVTTPYRKV